MKKTLFLSLLFLISCSKSVTRDTTNPPGGGSHLPNNAQINGPLTLNGNVSDKFRVSGNGQKVVYVADETTDTVDDLYVTDVPSLGNKLNLTNLGIGKKVTQFAISPNSLKVAFLANINNSSRYDLFTINLDGTSLEQVNTGLSANAQIVDDNFKWTSDSSRLIFVTDENSTGTKNLYIAQTDGSNYLQLNAVNGVFKTFALANDNSRVVYRLNTVNPTIRSVMLNATGDVMLNSAFNLGINPAAGIFDFKINNDSNKVVYRSNQDNGSIVELFSVNLDGTGIRSKMNGSVVSGGSVGSFDFANNAGTKVVYIADQDVDEVQELYVSNVDGSGKMKLSPALVSGGDLISFKMTQDGNRVVYLADQVTNGVNELFSIPVIGGTVSKINSNLSIGEQVADQYDLIGSQVLYAMDKGQSGIFSVYNNNNLGTSEIKLNPTVTTGQGFMDLANMSVDQFFITNDASRVIMLGSLDGLTRSAYSVQLNGAGFVKINNPSNEVLFGTSSLGSTAISVAPYVIYRESTGVQSNLVLSQFK